MQQSRRGEPGHPCQDPAACFVVVTAKCALTGRWEERVYVVVAPPTVYPRPIPGETSDTGGQNNAPARRSLFRSIP